MPELSTQTKYRSDKLIGYFLLGWTTLNILQACTLEVHPDEAYYWLYSRMLAWGYYDHPPMVALFIRLGDSLMHNELGLRLLTIIASSTSLYLLWLTLKRYAVNSGWFILIAPGILIFNIYGFTTTPDVPLFLFTALFYFIYQKYLNADKLKLALLLAIIIAGLLYSKYHGVLLIGFTVLANFRLFKRRSFYLIVILSALLYIPHILWQVHNGYPSLSYHLYERSADRYDPITTLLYLPGQLLMAGPLIGWFLFYLAVTVKVKDAFIRCLLINFIGTVVFFFFNTIKGEVQSHWTLIAFAPLIMLVMIRLKQLPRLPGWFKPVAVINLLLLLALRLSLIAGPGFITHSSRFQTYYGYKQWARQLKQQAGNSYVIFTSGFQEPSKYCYYTRSLKGFSYDARDYRRTQFELWPLEDSLQNTRTFYATDTKDPALKQDSFKTVRGVWYGTWVDSTLTYQRVDITLHEKEILAKPNLPLHLNLTINNPYNHPIMFKSSSAKPVALEACFFKDDGKTYTYPPGNDLGQIFIPAGKSRPYLFHCQAPPVKGKYQLVFSTRTQPFPGGRNSRPVTVNIQ